MERPHCVRRQLEIASVWLNSNCAIPNARPMILGMRKGWSFVARALLLAAAFLMAAQPVVFALSLTLQAAEDASGWGPIVICTAHGVVTLSEEADGGGSTPPPGQKAPNCPYCALGCNGGLAEALMEGSTPELCLPWGIVEVIEGRIEFDDAPRQLLRLLTYPPRAPPSVA